MTNADMIYKLMLGKDDFTEVIIVIEDEKIPINLRPLTAGELAQLKRMEQKSIKFHTSVGVDGKSDVSNSADIETDKFLEGQDKAKFQAVAWSMSCDGVTVTPEQVKEMKKEIPNLLFKHVIEVSCLTEKDLTSVKLFQ